MSKISSVAKFNHWNYRLLIWILSDNVNNFLNFKLSTVIVIVINRAAKFQSLFHVNSINLLCY